MKDKERWYTEEKFCDNCNRETMHEMYDSGHERDSSGDHFKCLECKWWGTGLSDIYHSPI